MRTKKGIVEKQVNDKTVVVVVHAYKTHPKYKKRYRVSKKYQVHNPENKKFEIGETIMFYETRPISKLKRFSVVAPESKKPDNLK
ncbi:MAG: 30S ribosomal protein S17 [Candidatus Gracilibacteria bacterium]|jgi:small subunit ribosomal protein S17